MHNSTESPHIPRSNSHYDENANPTTHIIAVSSESSSQVEEYLTQQGVRYSRLKIAGRAFKWGINIFVYATPLSVVFYELNLPKGAVPAALSVFINAPMSIEFFDQFLGRVIMNFNPRRVYPAFIVFSASGLVSGFLTSITGLQIATDALEDVFSGVLYRYGQAVFFLNTYTTRCVAWPLAMHELLESVTWRLCGRFKPVYDFINDLEANFLDPNVQKIRATNYIDFVNQFYTELEKKGKKPGRWSTYHLYKGIEMTARILSVAITLYFFDLFQYLGSEGWSKFSDKIAEMCILNFFTVLPNSIFYARSASMFLPTLRCVLRDTYIHSRYYSQEGRLSLNTPLKVAAMTILVGTGIVGSQVAAWFSGAGMAGEVERYNAASSNHTLPACVDHPNLSPVNFPLLFGTISMTGVAGLFCNGTGTLLLLNRCIIRQKIPAYSALSVLYEIKGSTMLRWDALERKFGGDFVNRVKERRRGCILEVEQALKDQEQKSCLDQFCFWNRKKQHTSSDVEALIDPSLHSYDSSAHAY